MRMVRVGSNLGHRCFVFFAIIVEQDEFVLLYKILHVFAHSDIGRLRPRIQQVYRLTRISSRAIVGVGTSLNINCPPYSNNLTAFMRDLLLKPAYWAPHAVS